MKKPHVVDVTRRAPEQWKKIVTNLRSDTRKAIIFRIVMLFVLTIYFGVGAFKGLEAIRSENEERQECAEEIKGETNIVQKNTADAILKQSEQFQSWAVLILTGIVALLITTKVHSTPGAQWAYLPLGPAIVFLLTALNTGWVLMKTYTFLLSLNNFSDFSSLANLLQMQSDLFLDAIICVSLFAGWFLLMIVFGKVKTFDVK